MPFLKQTLKSHLWNVDCDQNNKFVNELETSFKFVDKVSTQVYFLSEYYISSWDSPIVQ